MQKDILYILLAYCSQCSIFGSCLFYEIAAEVPNFNLPLAGGILAFVASLLNAFYLHIFLYPNFHLHPYFRIMLAKTGRLSSYTSALNELLACLCLAAINIQCTSSLFNYFAKDRIKEVTLHHLGIFPYSKLPPDIFGLCLVLIYQFIAFSWTQESVLLRSILGFILLPLNAVFIARKSTSASTSTSSLQPEDMSSASINFSERHRSHHIFQLLKSASIHVILYGSLYMSGSEFKVKKVRSRNHTTSVLLFVLVTGAFEVCHFMLSRRGERKLGSERHAATSNGDALASLLAGSASIFCLCLAFFEVVYPFFNTVRAMASLDLLPFEHSKLFDANRRPKLMLRTIWLAGVGGLIVFVPLRATVSMASVLLLLHSLQIIANGLYHLYRIRFRVLGGDAGMGAEADRKCETRAAAGGNDGGQDEGRRNEDDPAFKGESCSLLNRATEDSADRRVCRPPDCSEIELKPSNLICAGSGRPGDGASICGGAEENPFSAWHFDSRENRVEISSQQDQVETAPSSKKVLAHLCLILCLLFFASVLLQLGRIQSTVVRAFLFSVSALIFTFVFVSTFLVTLQPATRARSTGRMCRIAATWLAVPAMFLNIALLTSIFL